MKNLKTLFASALCLLIGTSSAFALNEAERRAQSDVVAYLKSVGIPSDIDSKDNSVNFLRNKVLYWITFDGSNAGITYTLHRRPIKMESTKADPDKNARRIEIARIATNLMNARNPYKSFVNGNRVEFVYPILASSPQAYTQVLSRLISSFDNVETDYKYNYDKAKHIADSIHTYWSENDTSYQTVPQKVNRVLTSGNNLHITDAFFRNISANGTEISGYDKNIRKSEAQFVQPAVVVYGDNKGVYRLGVQIKTPKGKILRPSSNSKMTIITPIDVTTNKKGKMMELDMFGVSDGTLWEAGDYQVTFFEDERPIKTTTFTIL